MAVSLLQRFEEMRNTFHSLSLCESADAQKASIQFFVALAVQNRNQIDKFTSEAVLKLFHQLNVNMDGFLGLMNLQRRLNREAFVWKDGGKHIRSGCGPFIGTKSINLFFVRWDYFLKAATMTSAMGFLE